MVDFADFAQDPAKIAEAKAEKLVGGFVNTGVGGELRFHGSAGDFKDLTHLPWNIAHAKRARLVAIPGTQVSDIRPLIRLENLQSLDIRETQVEDLRPILEMPYLNQDASQPRSSQTPALLFSDCKACELDPRLKEISEIEDDQERFISTVRHLRTLPPYPALLPQDEERIYREMNQKIDAFNESTSILSSQITNLHETLKETHKNNRNELDKQLSSGRKTLKDFNTLTDEANEALQATQRELETFKAEFTERVAVSGPVELWQDKQREHKTQQRISFGWLLFGLIGTVILACLVMASPDSINSLISPPGCNIETGQGCGGFSLMGALGIGSILTIFTVALWFTRLQMKLYLAERHMRLDAREREAFTKAYIGLLSAGDTSKEAADQRAVVYGALFRPSSDGTVKDDGGLDPAISAALSKLLTR